MKVLGPHERFVEGKQPTAFEDPVDNGSVRGPRCGTFGEQVVEPEGTVAVGPRRLEETQRYESQEQSSSERHKSSQANDTLPILRIRPKHRNHLRNADDVRRFPEKTGSAEFFHGPLAADSAVHPVSCLGRTTKVLIKTLLSDSATLSLLAYRARSSARTSSMFS